MKPTKKILIFSSEFPPLSGGIGNHAFNLAYFLNNKFEVTVLSDNRTSPEEGKLYSKLQVFKLKLVNRSKYPFVTQLTRLYYLIKYSNNKNAIIFSGKFPVLISFLIRKKSKILVVHGSEIKQKRLSHYFFKLSLKQSNKIVCVSSYTKSKLLQQYNFDHSKIEIINNGFNIKGHNLLNTKTLKPLTLITVGTIHERKGQINVINALPKILSKYPGTTYNIIGSPQEKKPLIKRINELKIKKNVVFYENTEDAGKIDLLKRAHIFCMLSNELINGDFEGFGIACIEAMSLGLPCLGTKKSGISDAIKDNYSGFLINPKDPEEILNSIDKIISNYTDFTQNSIKWSNEFKWEKKIKSYETLIDALS